MRKKGGHCPKRPEFEARLLYTWSGLIPTRRASKGRCKCLRRMGKPSLARRVGMGLRATDGLPRCQLGGVEFGTLPKGALARKLALLSNFRGRVYKGGLKRARRSPDRGAWAKELTGALRPLEDSGPGRNRDWASPAALPTPAFRALRDRHPGSSARPGQRPESTQCLPCPDRLRRALRPTI